MTHQSSITVTNDADSTEELGELFAQELVGGDVVLLDGNLAAGKTTLIRGIVRGLGGDPTEVNSPTFVVVQTYPCEGRINVVHHIDLYRLPPDQAALREIGMEEILADEDAVVAVEWPREFLSAWLPRGCRVWRILLSRLDEHSRQIEIRHPEHNVSSI